MNPRVTPDDLLQGIEKTRYLRDSLVALCVSAAGGVCLFAGMVLLSRWLP